MRNVGISHIEIDDTNSIVKHWRFEGTVNFNIAARSPFERDVISATIVNILAFGEDVPEFQIFHQDIHDYDFVGIKLMTDYITPGGQGVAAVPWNAEDEQLYTSSYSVKLFGEFFTDPQTANLINISKISIYPYTEDMAIPTGSTDPLDAEVEWVD